jgi:hypothetical protein
MQTPFLNLHEPLTTPQPLDEEAFAQQHGRVVRLPSVWDRTSLQLGRLFLKFGEKLTHEDPCGELTREAA